MLWKGLLELLSPPVCACCEGGLAARIDVFCAACRPLIDTAHEGAACVFGGPMREAIHRLKYEGRSELAPGLARWLVEAAEGSLGRVDVVVAVPLHPARLRERGYNQSLLLARPVASALEVPLLPRALRRARGRRPQVGRDRAARREALAGAFVAAPMAGLRVLVIDDVRTTGATLEEARRALREAGATSVHTLVLAEADAVDRDAEMV